MSVVAMDINDLGQVTGWYGIPQAGHRQRLGRTNERPHFSYRSEPADQPPTDDLAHSEATRASEPRSTSTDRLSAISTRSEQWTLQATNRGFPHASEPAIDPRTDDLCPPGVRLNHQGGLAINSQGEVVGKMLVGPKVPAHGELFGKKWVGPYNTRSFRTAPNRPIDPVTDDLGPRKSPALK